MFIHFISPSTTIPFQSVSCLQPRLAPQNWPLPQQQLQLTSSGLQMLASIPLQQPFMLLLRLHPVPTLSSVESEAVYCWVTALMWQKNRKLKRGEPALSQPHLPLTLFEFILPTALLSCVAFSLEPAILVTLDKSPSCSRPPPLIEKRTQKD